MPRILAIEADSSRRRALSMLVCSHVKAELVYVDSVRAAIGSLAKSVPDLIIAPPLLAPPDEAELLAHMKGLDSAPYIQMMTVPALELMTDAPEQSAPRRNFLPSVFHRRSPSLGPQYDRQIVATQIVDALERAAQLRLEYAEMLARREARRERESALVLARSNEPQMSASDAEVRAVLRERAQEQEKAERRIALRKGRGDVPWLSGIKLSWGPELQLINISSTGVLVETGSKFAPGSTTELHLSGPDTNIVVPVRFIRSDVARIDGLGVRYRAAAAFAKELDLAGPRQQNRDETPQQELASLMRLVLSESSGDDQPPHVRFAAGLRHLVGARDVQVRTGATGTPAGRETLYFDVPGDDRLRTTLQVVFDRNHDVTDAQFRLLKAAAWMTAAVIELERPSMPLLAERVA